MSEYAIRAVELGKQYRLGDQPRYKTLREAISGLVSAPWRRARTAPEKQFWALRDVSFEIKQGQAVGIIGRNGAGKSTLLKILAQITEPTEGVAHLCGRVGSLLEVGVGFHPELTGRENIYLNGALLGMKKAEIDRKFDEIVAFAEVEKFLDTQVKHYSSGMFVRLGFSVAAHLETEILFVDEILSVGDFAFQEKCLGKMQNVATVGRTVLFVSHNLLAIQALCQHVIWLDQGTVMAEGRPNAIASRYLESVRGSRTEALHENPQSAPGNDTVRLRRASARAISEHGDSQITVRTPVLMEFELWIQAGGTRLSFAVQLHNVYGILVLFSGLLDGRSYPAGLVRISAQIPGNLLNTGVYRIEFLVLDPVENPLWTCPDLLTFEVEDSLDLREGYLGEWPGAVRPHIPWTVDSVE
jgi:lipopolysaccharide transport system ATP-binding protein